MAEVPGEDVGWRPLVVEIFPSVSRHGWNLNLAAVAGHRHAYLVTDVAEDDIAPVETGRWSAFEYEAEVDRMMEMLDGILAKGT